VYPFRADLLREHVAAGGFGLWLEPDVLQGSPTVEAAIEATLRGLHPRIETGCGSMAIGLARRHGGLLLVADDVNRTSSPARLVQKIAGWSGPSEETSGRNEGYRILCPVWPQVIGQVADQAEKTVRDLMHLRRAVLRGGGGRRSPAPGQSGRRGDDRAPGKGAVGTPRP
jgi:hypothetical protein